MGDYQIGLDYERLNRRVEVLETLVQQLYALTEHNITIKNLETPKEPREAKK